jgi:hypothetical protein
MKSPRLLLVIAALQPAYGLPVMVRLGYGNCASCHVSPQGGGLLTEYGRGIDEAQSLRAGEYKSGVADGVSVLSAGGHLDQDFRIVVSDALSRLSGGAWASAFRSRFYYRTVTMLGRGWRVTATAGGENEATPRRSLVYDPSIIPGQAFIATALIQYRPKEGIELAAGRDQLPMGVYTGDLTTLVKARNRYGLYDTPTQAKLFLWGKRWQAVPYAFIPSGHEATLARERGGGVLAEYDLLGKGKTIVGVNILRGTAAIANRIMTGIYTRLGFGSWGILAEQDFTRRTYLPDTGAVCFSQSAAYIQTFRAFREWLVGSAIFERLDIAAPYRERLISVRAEISARLTPNFTVGIRAGMQYDRQAGGAAPVATVQLAWKTVGLRPW